MRNRTRSRISTSVLIVMVGAIFLAWKPQPSSAQDAPFKSYQLIVHCENPQLPAAMFWHDVKEHSMGLKSICVGNCPGGTVPIADALAGLPADVSAALKEQVKKHRFAGEGWFITCLRGGKSEEEKPPEEKKPECRKNSDSPNGKNCCDNVPGRGSLYAGTLDGRIYSEPSTNSTVVGSPPSGTRLRYTNTTQVNGQTWYYIESPGRERQGWMSGSQLSCTRPVEPPSPKRIIDRDRGMQLYNGTAAHTHAARG